MTASITPGDHRSREASSGRDSLPLLKPRAAKERHLMEEVLIEAEPVQRGVEDAFY